MQIDSQVCLLSAQGSALADINEWKQHALMWEFNQPPGEYRTGPRRHPQHKMYTTLKATYGVTSEINKERADVGCIPNA